MRRLGQILQYSLRPQTVASYCSSTRLCVCVGGDTDSDKKKNLRGNYKEKSVEIVKIILNIRGYKSCGD